MNQNNVKPMKWRSLLIGILWILPLISWTQEKKKIDSLLQIVGQGKPNTATANAYGELALELLGYDNQQAKKYARKGVQLSEQIKDKKTTAFAFHSMGLSYDYLGIADSAFYYYTKSIALKKELGDADGEASTLLNIGVLYFYQKEYERALNYYQQALELYQKTKNELRVAAALNNMGAIYRIQKKYEKAIEIYQQSYQLKEKSQDLAGMSNALNNLGIVLMYMKQFEKAESYLLRSLALQKKSNSINNLISSYLSIANLYIKMGRLEDGRKSLNQAIKIGDSLDMPHEMIDAYQMYTVIDSTSGDFKSAFEHLKRYHQQLGKVIQSDRKKEIDRLETLYQTQEKEREIALNKASIENRNRAIVIFSVISGLLCFLAIWLLWLRRKLHLSNRQLNQLVVEKENLVKEIHHRVKNNLQVISSLLNMHVRKVQDPDSKKIFDDGVSRIQAMSIIHQNIYHHKNSMQQKPIDYIEKLIQQLYITYQIPEKSIQIHTQIDDIPMDIEKLMGLGLILNELLSNAFKYAFKHSTQGVIDIKLQKRDDQQLELTVKDDGVGIHPDATSSDQSLGMKLIYAFSQKLNGKLSFMQDNGTVFVLQFNPL